MASGVEDGTLVCSTGKISRLIGTLDGIGRDGHKEARPMWAVRMKLLDCCQNEDRFGRRGERCV
jgi:hypothetical protein